MEMRKEHTLQQAPNYMIGTQKSQRSPEHLIVHQTKRKCQEDGRSVNNITQWIHRGQSGNALDCSMMVNKKEIERKTSN